VSKGLENKTGAHVRRFKPYSAYKDSGVEWLGKVPELWMCKPLKRIFRTLNGATPRSAEPEYWDGDIPWVTPEDLGDLRSDVISETRRMITEAGYNSCGTSLAPKGSLILSTRAPIGHLAIAGTAMCSNQGCRSLVFRNEDNTRYFYYLLLAARSELTSFGEGSTFKELSRTKLETINLITPRSDEQRAIAAFLDRETTRIDQLIAKKERQIELLQEKRSALISHAVTKGLNPKAKMKDSGIEWLGEIPEHWDVFRSKVVFAEINDRSDTGAEELLSVSHITGVTPRSEKEVNMFMAESMAGYKKCKRNDLVVNTMWAWMGAMGIAFHDGIVSPSYNTYRFRSSAIEPRYYDFLFRTRQFISEVICCSKGVWQSRLRLYPEEFFGIRVPCPPSDEQRKIVIYIDQQTGYIEEMRRKIEKSIGMLREYRTVLISAAVTGKIDVREEVA